MTDDALLVLEVNGHDGVAPTNAVARIEPAGHVDDGRRARLDVAHGEALAIEGGIVPQALGQAAVLTQVRGLLGVRLLDVAQVNALALGLLAQLRERYELLRVAVGPHETLLGLAGLLNEHGTLEEVLEALERQLGVGVVELLELKLHRVIELLEEVPLRRHAGGELGHQGVAGHLVALHRRAVATHE